MQLIAALLLSSALILPVSGFVPSECARQFSDRTRPPIRCCPSNCGGPKRGLCAAVELPHPEKEFLGLPPGSPLLKDDRLDWPTGFFSHLCHCRGRRFGAACEACRPGWSGSDCEHRVTPSIRRSLTSLSAEERKKFRQLMLLSRSRNATTDFALLVEDGESSASDPLRRPRFLYGESLHFYLVHVHFYAQRGTLSVPRNQCERSQLHFNFNHQGNNFLPWHRYFVLVWERALQLLAARELNWPDFALPYWDWTDATACGVVCSDDLFGLKSAKSPFRLWEELCSSQFGHDTACFGCLEKRKGPKRNLARRWMGSEFPNRDEVQFVQSRPRYYRHNDMACDSLVLALEGECGPGGLTARFFMHNRLHALVNGSFSHGATSPNDPLFPLHHAQIDRILESWLRSYGHSRAVLELPDMHQDRPGHGPESYLVGFIPLMMAKDVLVPTEALGYTYDTFRLY